MKICYNDPCVKKYTERIFSYGTLQYPDVQFSTFGRYLSGKQDILTNYVIHSLPIQDDKVIALSGEDTHKILVFSGNANDRVEGKVFEITEEELMRADAYEVNDYTRIKACLESGENAWVYVQTDNHNSEKP